MDEIQNQVMTFLANELALPLSAVRPEKRLRQDLKIDGAEAWQLIEGYGVRFEVDVDDFRFTDYFGENPQPQWIAVVMGLFGNARPLRTLYVADLVRGAKAGFLR